jgi:hypothetical protein
MKPRISLVYVDDQIVLPALIESRSLRINMQVVSFVLDTGTRNSYFSEKEVQKLQISLAGRPSAGKINFAGASYESVLLPKITMRLLKEGGQVPLNLQVTMHALKSKRKSEDKKTIAEFLPSLLGMDFLRENNLSLHVVPKEHIAYLEYE